jgi:nucleoside-diphosphate-sugar epimerase
MTGPLLLTGASGWFGRTALYEYEQEHGPEALRRDVITFASRERWVDFDSPHGPVKARPLEAITEVNNPAGLLHLAFLTRDKLEVLGWERYVTTNRAITAKLAEVLKAWPAMPVVSTSSGAAAALDGQPPDLEGNPYATLKQEEEALLESESATRMAMVFRVYAASGRFMTRPEKFALGDFLLQALRGEAITLQSRRDVLRSYVHAGTLMRLAWRLLQARPPLNYYRVDACQHTTTLRELALTVSERFTLPPPRHEVDQALPPDRYTADDRPFVNLLARMRIMPWNLAEQIEETAAGLRSRTRP